MSILHGWPSWWVCPTHWLLVTNFSGNEELLHGHVVHGREVCLHRLMAVVHVLSAEVLLEVDNILSHHDGVLQVHFNPLQALHTLFTGVSKYDSIITEKIL